MFRSLLLRSTSRSLPVAVSAAGHTAWLFVTSCGRGLLRQTRFQATGFCLAVLGLAMYHLPSFGQPPGESITITVTGGSDLGKVPVGTYYYFGTLNASAAPDPGNLTWTWSGPTGGAGGMGYVMPGYPSNTAYVGLWPNSAGSQTYTFTA